MSAGTTVNIKPLSVNKAWQGGRFKTDTYKTYESDLMLMLPKLSIPEGDIDIYLDFGLSNRAGDWDNPIKPFVDVLQKKYGFDDKRIYNATVKKTIVKKGQEYIRFLISRSEAY